jgi:subtilisin family serine protease
MAALVLGGLGAPASAADWSVLQYDENGVAIGVRGTATDGEGGAARNGFGSRFNRAVEPGELLLVDITDDQVADLVARGYEVIRRDTLDSLDFMMVQMRVPDNVELPDALAFVEATYPEVTVTPNDLLDLPSGPRPQIAQAAPDDDFSRAMSGWGDVPETCGEGIVLGQIDGFVETSHAALRGKRLNFESFLLEDRIPAAEDHGTAVAVMLIGRAVSGRRAGLLPGATLYAANIFERRKGRDVGNLAALVRAIDWLATNNVRVANLSIAGSENKIMRLAVSRAVRKGVMLVAAAGNNGAGAPPAWPAAHPESMAVTAVDRGLRLYRHANHGDYIDFAAPGVDIPTQTPNGLKPQSGTSFAAPFVTAMVAIHLKAGFEPDPDIIRRSLQRYTRDLGQTGRDPVFGWGLVRLRPTC